MHGDGCRKRIKRGLFKCRRLKKVFNADLVAAYNILITPSPERDRGNWPGSNPKREM
jgi:putative transposase